MNKIIEATQEQLDACHRAIDPETNEVFYCLASATTAGTFYEVRYLRAKAALTCTCPAGNPPLDAKGYPVYAPKMCWHRRSVLAHAKEYREAQKAECEAMRKRIEEANQHPYQWHEREVQRNMERFEGRPFSLLK